MRWNNLKKEMNALEKVKIRNMYRDRVNRIISASSTREYWDNLNFFRTRKRSVNGSISMVQLVEYYRNIFPVRSQYVFDLENVYVQELDDHFTFQELEVVLEGAKARKAAGSYGIPSEFYKFFTRDWRMVLLELFHRILDE